MSAGDTPCLRLSAVAAPGPSSSRRIRRFQGRRAWHREFRFRVRGLDGSMDAVSPRRDRGLRPRPDTAAGWPGRLLSDPPPDGGRRRGRGGATITIDEADLAGNAEAHTNAPKHRSWSLASPTVEVLPAGPEAPPVVARRAAPAVAVPEPVLQGGQRISHAVFGLGVMSAPTGVHTMIHFDQDGSKRFVTSMLDVDLLSAPHTWETTVRGEEPASRLS